MEALANLVESMVLFYLQPAVKTRSIFSPAQIVLIACGGTTLVLSDLESLTTANPAGDYPLACKQSIRLSLPGIWI